LKIKLEDLENNPEGQMTLEFDEVINDLENNKPVTGTITLISMPGGVEVTGSVETDLILECDRCMKKFEYHIKTDINEELIKYDIVSPETKEFEITRGNFVEELKGRKEIDVTDIIYQDIILNIPGKKLCDRNCPGSDELQRIQAEKPSDPRMQVFNKFFDEENK